MVDDLGLANRNEVYAPNADAKGNIAPINAAEEQAKREEALKHRAAARNIGSAKINNWYSKSSPSLCLNMSPLLTLHIDPDNFEDHSGGTENICAGQAHRPVAIQYQAATTPAVSGHSSRAADPRSLGGIKVVNGVTTIIPPTTGTSSGPHTSAGATTRASAAGHSSRQATKAGKPTGSSTSKTRVPPANAPRAPRAHYQAPRTSNGRNNGPLPARSVPTGMTAEAMVEFAMQNLAVAARNKTLGRNFLPSRYLPATDNVDAPGVTRAKLRITAAAFKSAEPTEFITDNDFTDIFYAARKYLVEGTFRLLLFADDPQTLEKQFEAFEGFEFKHGLHAFAMRALKECNGNSGARETLRAEYESESQLDVVETALKVIAIGNDLFNSSNDCKTSTPSCGDNEDKTDMSIQVTTTIEQTTECVDPAVADTQPYGVTTSVTGPVSSTANVRSSSQQDSTTMGRLDYAFTIPGATLPDGEGAAKIFPPGVQAFFGLQFENDDCARKHMSNVSALIESLEGFASLLKGEKEKPELEAALAAAHGVNQSAAQGRAQSEEFDQATTASSPAADESLLVHHSESVCDDSEKSDSDGYLLVENSQTAEAYDSDESL